MSTPEAPSATSTPPKKAATTLYAILISQLSGDWRDHDAPIRATSAPAAIRKWAESVGPEFTSGTVRAIPTSRITEVVVGVKNVRQLTLGAP